MTQLTEWEGRSVEHWRDLWQVPELAVFQATSSTNDYIRVRAEQGAPAGICAIAEQQTSGRGRRHKRWDAAPGEALLLSMLFRPEHESPADFAGTIPLRVGIAIARAIEAVTELRVALKWPNDVHALDGRKLAGILCESSLTSRGVAYTVVGVGINVHQSQHELHPDVRRTAASLAMVSGQMISRGDLATAVVTHLQPLSLTPAGPLTAAELNDYSKRDALAQHSITADDVPVGVAAGIGPGGDLLVRNGDEQRSIHAGTIRKVQ